VGDGFQKIARNDAVGFFAQRLNVAADVVEHIPVAGKAFAAGLSASAKVVSTFSDTVQAFTDRGRQIAGLNGYLAASTAKADVTTLLADIREADRTGEKLGKLIEQQAALEAILRELIAPIKSWLIDQLSAIMGGILKGIEGILAGLNEYVDVGAETLKEVRAILKRLERDEGSTDLVTSLWLSGLETLTAPPAPPVVAPFAFPPGLAFPPGA